MIVYVDVAGKSYPAVLTRERIPYDENYPPWMCGKVRSSLYVEGIGYAESISFSLHDAKSETELARCIDSARHEIMW